MFALPERGPIGHLPGDEPQRTTVSSSGGGGASGRPPRWQWVLLVVALLGMVAVATMRFGAEAPEEVDFTTFVSLVEAGDVERIAIDEDGRVQGELADETPFETVVPTALPQDELVDMLVEHDVTVEARAPSPEWIASLIWLVPFLLIIGLIVWFLYRGARGQMSQLQGMGRSQAEVIESERPDTTFDDVAGYSDVREEVGEIIDFLRDPNRFRKVGVRGPGGVLMVGPAGTGKTLMARAVAGEADVPFISASGSEFVEMLVGVGAARIRDLFKTARERSPSIIFIDELDSVGRKRGGQQTIGSNNEQEQTLNQLLKELDGFDPRTGVVIIGATNRPEMLDEALLRPGRFDRQVEVALPSQRDRVAILEVHCRGKPIGPDVDLDRVARATPGFSGAQLQNLVNEAGITAVRDGRDVVAGADFEAARDRIAIGRRQGSDLLRAEEKDRVAVHEAGHALVAAVAEEADPVSKVTILPARHALGTTEQLPIEERRLAAASYLHDSLTVRLGGRAAETVVFDELSTGAAEDLAGATELATRMVAEFGLSEKLGPVGYRESGDAGVLPGLGRRPYAEDTQRQVDEEVARLLRESEARAERLIHDHRAVFDEIVSRLHDREVVDGAEIYELLGRPVPGAPRRPPPTDDERSGDP